MRLVLVLALLACCTPDRPVDRTVRPGDARRRCHLACEADFDRCLGVYRDVCRYREDARMPRVWYECSVPAGRCHCRCEPGEGGCDE